MSFSLDSAIGIFPASINLRDRRAELLASNMANDDTPNYKSLDFHPEERLTEILGFSNKLQLITTQSNHIPLSQPDANQTPELLYRIPAQPSLDGNTVDPQFERAAFAENSMKYQSTLEFFDRRVASLRAALRKE